MGGSTPADRNVVSGNADDGISVDGSSGNTILGNYVGVTAPGDSPLANDGEGIAVQLDAANNTIGGAGPNDGNVIAGNGLAGILVAGEGSDGTTIQGNHIGTNAAGTAQLAKGNDAITISAGGDNTVIGGPGVGNLIAHSGGDGIEITGPSTGTVIQGNTIGTDLTGTADWSGQYSTVAMELGASDTLIGGTAAGEGNVLANAGTNPANPNSISIWSDAGSGIAILGQFDLREPRNRDRPRPDWGHAE